MRSKGPTAQLRWWLVRDLFGGQLINESACHYDLRRFSWEVSEGISRPNAVPNRGYGPGRSAANQYGLNIFFKYLIL
jgi:hypothetical protein